MSSSHEGTDSHAGQTPFESIKRVARGRCAHCNGQLWLFGNEWECGFCKSTFPIGPEGFENGSEPGGFDCPELPHLQNETTAGCRTDIVTVRKEREFWCEDCGSRVTLSPDGQREYGHHRKCDHAIDRRNGWDWSPELE